MQKAASSSGIFNWCITTFLIGIRRHRRIFSPFYMMEKRERDSLFRKSRSQGPFTPLSKQGTIVYPGLDGGAEWGGAAADPDGILYINSSEMAWRISLGPSNTKRQNVSMSSG